MAHRNREISSVHPAAHLPTLADIAHMTLPERRVAIAAWVSWFNGHRDRVDPEFERELDRALSDLERDQTRHDDVLELQNRFDEWLATAGLVGEGQGPDEKEHSPEAEIENMAREDGAAE